jgi:hypothetical protein
MRDYLDKFNFYPIFPATYCQERKVSVINKFQITNSKQITMAKIPNSKQLVFDLIWIWVLEFNCSLVPVTCYFRIIQVKQAAQNCLP